ncbi:rCG24526 [Rattus norvegicus]|uniref:RCG24526 n=1 Tax=Rattus norvegicus TaxID=10116 RepID=A6JCA4_RAT|nr:rCG24526 [Rattus norvegicus]
MGLQRNPGLLLTGLCVGLLFSWMNLAQPTDLSDYTGCRRPPLPWFFLSSPL